MADKTSSITIHDGIQGVGKLIKLASVDTGDTITWPEPVRAWIPINETTADAFNVTYDSTEFTLVVANTPDVAILIL